MRLLQDGVIAALAAVGLTTIIWFVVGALLHPWERCSAAIALVKAQGSAAELEQTVRQLQRSRGESCSFSRIVIVDCGMEEEARQVAELLCREEYDIAFTAIEDLSKAIL